jgi:DNA replication protein DnaC
MTSQTSTSATTERFGGIAASLAARGVSRPDPAEYERARAEREDAELRAVEESVRSQRLRRAHLPKARLSSAPTDAERADAAALLSGRTPGLLLCGDVGRGKTWRASGIAWAAVEAGTDALLATEADYLGALKTAMGGPWGEYEAVDARYRSAGLLVLDDLGKEPPTEWALARLFDVLDWRCREQLPTVATTQHSPAELLGVLARGGEKTARAIGSRMQPWRKELMRGPDMRAKGGRAWS